jgi:hypothetical protein
MIGNNGLLLSPFDCLMIPPASAGSSVEGSGDALRLNSLHLEHQGSVTLPLSALSARVRLDPSARSHGSILPGASVTATRLRPPPLTSAALVSAHYSLLTGRNLLLPWPARPAHPKLPTLNLRARSSRVPKRSKDSTSLPPSPDRPSALLKHTTVPWTRMREAARPRLAMPPI